LLRQREDGRAGSVIRNQESEMQESGGEVASVECFAKAFKAGGELGGRQLAGLDGDYRGLLGRCSGENGAGLVGGGPELLGDFVAGAGRGEVDGDLTAGGQLADHEVGEVRDVVGRGEYGRKQSRWHSEGGCDEKQVDGFVEGEEVATGGGIGDRDGTALGDLLGEELNNTVAGGENVAEAENGASGGEDDLLSDTLGGAHDGSRFDGLVSREQDEARTVGGGGHGECFGGEDVVSDGGEGLFFHEGNVLEGGGVEDDAGAVGGEDVLD